MAPEPGFPVEEAILSREKKIKDIKDTIKSVVQSLCYRWTFDLKIPAEQESPSSRENLSLEQQCVTMIIGICWKDKSALLDVAEQFEKEAYAKWRGWVNKPEERGTVPEKTRHRPCPVSDEERVHLLGCLHQRLSAAWEPIKKQKTPKRFHAKDTHINDTPIRLSFGTSMEGPSGQIPYPALNYSSSSSSESKRARDDSAHNNTPVKKAKASSDVPRPKSTNTMGPPPPDPFLNRGRPFAREGGPKSADTSFASTVPSVFSQGPNYFSNSTQETVPDDEPELPPRKSLSSAFTTRQPDNNLSSSEFSASSSFERRMAECQEEEFLNLSIDRGASVIPSEDTSDAEELSQGLLDYSLDDDDLTPAEKQLKASLKQIFPTQLPRIHKDTSFFVLYEITRIFLYAEVPLEHFDGRITSDLHNYNNLWTFLKGLRVLRDKPFPERCSAEIWKYAMDGEYGPHIPVFAGSLSFTSSSSLKPLFKFRLEPLKLEKSHRLDRRFGSDRFLEICIPQITDSKAPDAVSRIRKQIRDERWRAMICDWLVDAAHPLLGRSWKPFFVKSTEKKSRRRQAGDDGPGSGHRLYFFAVDGIGFVNDPTLISNPDPKNGHAVMTVNHLLERIRPTRKNVHQSYLKLFSRTSLAVSRNLETLVLEQSQIRFQPKNITWPRDDPDGEVMNDGAAKISRSLAFEVAKKLGLSNIPSGFQGRLGEAKGFWLVDHTDKSDEKWIEVYPSQQKWTRSTKPNGESDDRSHRTFEVLKYSTPLKSADLNTQLVPLLMERSVDEETGIDRSREMKDALADLLREGLARQLSDMREAINEPYTFKKWVRDNKSNLTERVKAGDVPFRGGLPVAIEERLNVLLDSGFQPKKLNFMIGLTRDVFKSKCDELGKRMNITVGKCVYAYMVPDFWGILGPGEVYIDFSSFKDDISGFSGAMLNDDDVLVARNPAHFPSDIQKVRAVVKKELMGLKDVIVFSTIGNPSLASKLSGGDYDGDIAWVCFEPRIVNNFFNAKLPQVPDLVAEGLLKRDTLKYKELVHGQPSPTSVFLKKSFEFNLQPSMLGIVTAFKDTIRYTKQRSDIRESTYFNQLCSDLVDQNKQGYIFDRNQFTNFKRAVMTFTPKQIPHKSDPTWVPQRGATDIIEHLMWVAVETMNKSLAEFWAGIDQAPWFDEDLVRWQRWVRDKGEKNTEWSGLWKNLLEALETDIKAFKKSYADRPRRADSTFDQDVVVFHEKFRDIRPHTENAVTELLIGEDLVEPELSQWEQLKASVLFASYKSESVMPWYFAGRQLCLIKAICGKFGPGYLVIPGMYIAMKPDPIATRLMLAGGHTSSVEDNASVVNVDDLDDFEDD